MIDTVNAKSDPESDLPPPDGATNFFETTRTVMREFIDEESNTTLV